AVAWVVGCGWLAIRLHEWVLRLRVPGQRLIEAGEGLQRTFGNAAQTAGRVPFVGGELSGALGHGSDAGAVMVDAGRSQIDAVDYSATGLAVAVIVLGLLPVLWYGLRCRLRYARVASAAVAMRAQAPELLALRALTTQPVRRVLAISADPAAAWRRGEPETIDRLAAVQLASLGLRPRRDTAVP